MALEMIATGATRLELCRIASVLGPSIRDDLGLTQCSSCQDSADSDIDLLVDLSPGTGLFTLVSLRGQLEGLLEANVDLVPADSRKDTVRQNVLDTVTL